MKSIHLVLSNFLSVQVSPTDMTAVCVPWVSQTFLSCRLGVHGDLFRESDITTLCKKLVDMGHCTAKDNAKLTLSLQFLDWESFLKKILGLQGLAGVLSPVMWDYFFTRTIPFHVGFHFDLEF